MNLWDWLERCLFLVVVLFLGWQWLRARRKAQRYRITDPLTGLLNRRGFEDRLKGEFNRATRKGYRIAVVYLDCDGFKAVNDNRGHAAGDVILQQIATVIQQNIRSYDEAGRIGGDEFVILMPEVDERTAIDIIGRIQAALEPTFRASPESISLSIGHAISSDQLATPSDLLIAADRAMYKKKEEVG